MSIHPSAVVDSRAELHPSVDVGPWCVVGPNVKIDEGTQLKSHAVVEGHTQIGKNNVIFPFSVIGVIPQDLKYQGEPTKLIIGDRNQIRESVSIHVGTVQGGGETRIGNENLLMGYVHVGHDTIIGNNCILANYVGLAGHVILEDYVNLGGQIGVSQYARVGAHSYIGGQAGVEKDVPPFCIGFGQRPCQIRGANIVGLRRHGFSVETIQKVNEAIKLWVRPDVQKEQCILEIESQYGENPHIQELISFIKDSKMGVIK